MPKAAFDCRSMQNCDSCSSQSGSGSMPPSRNAIHSAWVVRMPRLRFAPGMPQGLWSTWHRPPSHPSVAHQLSMRAWLPSVDPASTKRISVGFRVWQAIAFSRTGKNSASLRIGRMSAIARVVMCVQGPAGASGTSPSCLPVFD